jgi:hypothetical protein
MGCAYSRKENQIIQLLDDIIITLSLQKDSDPILVEVALLRAIRAIGILANKKKACHPIVLHEYNYAMSIMYERHRKLHTRLKTEIIKTYHIIAEKSPTMVVDESNTRYLYFDPMIMLNGSPQCANTKRRSSSCDRSVCTTTSTNDIPIPVKTTLTMSTDSTTSSPQRLKSFYLTSDNTSQETLGDFGFFDEAEILCQ